MMSSQLQGRVHTPRRTAAVIAGKLTGAASRVLRRGGGTALPGLVATRLDPDLVRDLAGQLSAGSVVVSGTNGKTTTSRMVATILSGAGFDLLRNQSGSNLVRGLATSLVREATLTGNLAPHDRRLGLFEVDEATLPEVLTTITPRAVLLLDLFRDQLDRYGEVATVARIWAAAIRNLTDHTAVVANADDPLVAEVVTASGHAAVFFGMESAARVGVPEHASDVKACPRCGGRIEYSALYLGHLGHYGCARCDFRRPLPLVSAADVRLNGVSGSSFDLQVGPTSTEVSLHLPGLYNVYNAVGAAALAHALGQDVSIIAAGLGRVTPAFGRMERLQIEGKEVYLALSKNPAGLNEVLRTLVESDNRLYLLMMLNDNIADGQDVSWIWDADVEMLQGRVASVVFAGTRAEDMALRFKYAGVTEGSAPQIVQDTAAAFSAALNATPEGGRLFVVPTYTALLDIRNTLTRLGHVPAYWEE